MTVWHFVDVSVPEAQHLADLTGVASDLKATASICDLFLEECHDMLKCDWKKAEALCASAIVRYGRAFGSGVRKGVPGDVLKGLDNDDLVAHAYFLNLRNKWIAHSVSAFEEQQVVAYLTPEDLGTKSIASVSVGESRVVAISAEMVCRLKELSQKIWAIVDKLVALENEAFLRYLRTLPVEQFYEQLQRPLSVKWSATDESTPRAKFFKKLNK